MSPVEILIRKVERKDQNNDDEKEMFHLLNGERIKRGLPLFKLDRELSIIARSHSLDMWKSNFFSHVNHQGESAADRVRRWGVDFTLVGENIALSQSVEEAHKGLMDSPGHRRNILDPGFKAVGIGIFASANEKFITQVFKG